MQRVIIGGAVLLAVTVLLLVPFHPEAPLLAFVRQVSPDTALAHRLDWLLVESGGNFALFAVVGAAALAIVRRPIVAALIGCSLSAAGETAQLVIPDRVASWTDFGTNCLGALVGLLIARAVLTRHERRRSTQLASS